MRVFLWCDLLNWHEVKRYKRINKVNNNYNGRCPVSRLSLLTRLHYSLRVVNVLQKVAFSKTAQCLAVFGHKNKYKTPIQKKLNLKKLVCDVISSIGNNITHVFALDVVRRILGEYNFDVIECECIFLCLLVVITSDTRKQQEQEKTRRRCWVYFLESNKISSQQLRQDPDVGMAL